MYTLCFYVPSADAEAVKSAVFKAGAGQVGNYSQCSFETLGHGQFNPNVNAKPYIGATGITEIVQELKVEMVCTKELIKPAVQALLEAHPYEEVAYQVQSFLTLQDL